MKFNERLYELNENENIKESEKDGAVIAFERLKTAQTICHDLFGKDVSPAVVVSVFSELNAIIESGASLEEET